MILSQLTIKRFAILVFTIGCINIFYSQDTTYVYFYKEYSSAQNLSGAEYIQKTFQSNDRWVQAIYWASGQVKTWSTFKDETLVILDGDYINYYKNGSIKTKGNYINGLEDGEWNWWHENKAQFMKVNYQKGFKTGKVKAWHPNGNKLFESEIFIKEKDKYQRKWFSDSLSIFQRVDLIDGNFIGECKTWFENGDLKSYKKYNKEGKASSEWITYNPNRTINSKIFYNKGKRTGKWEWFDKKGRICATEEFFEGANSTKHHFDSLGVDIPLVNNENAMYPDGGTQALMLFIQKNIEYPNEAINQNIRGKVWIRFTIDEKGKILSGRVLKGVHPLLDNEALKIIELLPIFEPAIRNNQVSVSTLSIPISFNIQ